jgi:hypothetical protein
MRKIALVSLVGIGSLAALQLASAGGTGNYDPFQESRNHNPKMSMDIIGRELASTGASFLGHVGVWDSDGIVYQMKGNLTAYNDFDAASLANFQNASPWWGAGTSYNVRTNAYYQAPNSADGYNIKSVCSDWVTCPRQVTYSDIRTTVRALVTGWYSVGAVYTLLDDFYQRPTPGYMTMCSPFQSNCTPQWVRGSRGAFRCDTMVKAAYGDTGVWWMINQCNEFGVCQSAPPVVPRDLMQRLNLVIRS